MGSLLFRCLWYIFSVCNINIYYIFNFLRFLSKGSVCALYVEETGASPPTGHVRHLALTCLQLYVWQFRKYGTVAHSSMHFSRKHEAGKSKTETLRDENRFLELKVRTTHFLLFQIHKLLIVIFQTFILPKYTVYIIVSVCYLLLTLFDDLNLYFHLKHHYPSWGTSAYFPRAHPPISLMKLYWLLGLNL